MPGDFQQWLEILNWLHVSRYSFIRDPKVFHKGIDFIIIVSLEHQEKREKTGP